MATLVQKLAVQTLKTFSLSRRHPDFNKNLLHLKDIASGVTAKDLFFDEKLVQNQEKFHPSLDSAPVTYVHIWEDDMFTMGIFVLRHGSRLPLHDHPGMHGVIKVIHGSMSVKSYSVQPSAPVPADVTEKACSPNGSCRLVLPSSNPSTETVLDVQSQSAVLYPEANNLHEIRAVDGPSAFLDILSPPYDHDSGHRVCHYFEVLPESEPRLPGPGAESAAPGTRYLAQVPQPPDFWCSSADYMGPDPDPYGQES